MGAIVKFTPRPPRPPGGGGGSEPLTVEALRAEIEAGVQTALDVADRFIAILDRMDADPDIEDGGDDEPSLGAPEGHEAQIIWLRGNDQDRETTSPEVILPDLSIEPKAVEPLTQAAHG